MLPCGGVEALTWFPASADSRPSPHTSVEVSAVSRLRSDQIEHSRERIARHGRRVPCRVCTDDGRSSSLVDISQSELAQALCCSAGPSRTSERQRRPIPVRVAARMMMHHVVYTMNSTWRVRFLVRPWRVSTGRLAGLEAGWPPGYARLTGDVRCGV